MKIKATNYGIYEITIEPEETITITQDDKKLPFFQKVDLYIKDLWKTFVISGKLTTPLFKREITHSRIESPNEQKVCSFSARSFSGAANLFERSCASLFLERALKPTPVAWLRQK